MIKAYEIRNVRCDGCARTIKKALGERLAGVEVDLGVMPRIVRAEIVTAADERFLLETVRRLGYPLVGEDNGLAERVRSVVSCAVGRLEPVE